MSASGGDLGGNFVFAKRLGFTGTLSEMLPMSMGACGFQQGTEGEMVHTLTNLEVMKPVSVSKRDWTSTLLLDMIARGDPSLDQPMRALIDTGALISGLTNKQVSSLS